MVVRRTKGRSWLIGGQWTGDGGLREGIGNDGAKASGIGFKRGPCFQDGGADEGERVLASVAAPGFRGGRGDGKSGDNIGPVEVAAFEQQRFAGGFGERIGETVP
jgi:hypothetical protein